MRGAASLLFLLAAIGLAPTARGQVGPAGEYVAEMRETASALELSPDGRFRWAFIQGSRDMFAEGSWRTAEGGGVLLTTEPPAEPPDVTLLGTERLDEPGVAVRVTGPDGQDLPYVQFLTVEGETPAGEWIDGVFDHESGRHEFRDLDQPVAVVAVRLAIPAYRFRSARFALPDGAGLIRLGFAVNSLARGDFRETRLSPEGDALILTLFDQPIRYRRLAGEEAGAATGIIDDIAAEMGIVVPLEGPVEIAIGEPLDRRLSRSLADEGTRLVLPGQVPIDLSVRMAGRTVDFGRVGGPGLLVFSIDLAGWPSTVDAVSFSYQDRPLLLAEGIERGRALERLLRGAGFAEPTDLPPGWTPQQPFEALSDEGDAARAANPLRADDWDGAARLLAEAEPPIASMRLFELQAPGVFANVSLDNFRLIAGRGGVPVGPEYAEGRDWLLSVTLHRDPRSVPPSTLFSEVGVDDTATSEVSPSAAEQEAHLACINFDERPSRAEAIARCTALLESAGHLPETIFVARVNRGTWLNLEGQHDRAIADFDEAIRLFPDYGVAYWGRANVHERRGDFVRAAADSREAAQREPENASLLNSLCWHLGIVGEALDEAREACDASLAIRPDDAPTLDSRGLVGLKQGRFDEAWADYDAAVRHGGENHATRASFLYGRGVAALRLGRTAEGQRDLADASQRDPAIAATYARHGVRP